MVRFRLSDMILFTLLFVACVSFPFNQLNIEYWAKYLIRIALQIILLILYYWMIRRNGIRVFGEYNKKNLIYLSPTLIIIFINIITLMFANYVYVDNPISPSFYPNGTFFFELALAVLAGINEEIVFRLIIHNSLNIKHRLLKILASAGIFALMHFLNFFTSGFNTQVLIQVAYTFGLGLILGFVYEYGRSFIICVIYHALYNVFNNVIFSVLILPSYQNQNLQYYLPIGLISLAIAIYIGCLYYFVFRKKEYIYY